MKKLKFWFCDNIFSIHFLRLLICVSIIALILCLVCLNVFAVNGYFPFTITLTNSYNLPFSHISTEVRQGGSRTWVDGFSTIVTDELLWTPSIDIALGSEVDVGSVIIGDNVMQLYGTDIPTGKYSVIARTRLDVESQPYLFSATYHNYEGFSYSDTTGETVSYSFFVFDDIENATTLNVEDVAEFDVDIAYAYILIPYDDGTTECPSLQVQINQFPGTYNEFEGLLLGSVNDTIYQGYRNKLSEQFRLGAESVTLEQLLADYDGSFQQLITLLSENNLRLLDEYALFIEEQRTQSYNDGYAQGNEEGFNDGYSRGYNKASSEQFGETLLGDTFNMPLNALNNWVLFETSTGLQVTMGGLFTAVIALAVLVIFLKMFAGG